MANKRGMYIFDSFAVLAFLEGEPGAEKVKRLLQEAGENKVEIFLSMINLGEVLYIIERERNLVKAQEVLALIDQLPIQIIQADRELVLDAAHIKANYAVAYADAFAIALARRKNGIVLTGDPEFQKVKDLVVLEALS